MMEPKSPKRTREVESSKSNSGKRLKVESGLSQPIPNSPNPSILTVPPIDPIPSLPEVDENLATVKKALSRFSEAKTRLLSSQNQSLDPAAEGKNVSSVLQEVTVARDSLITDLSERYEKQRRTQADLRTLILEHETRLRELETRLRDVQSDSQTKMLEKKREIERLEADKSFSVTQYRRDMSQLNSMLDNYRRLTGLDITTLEPGKMRCKVKLQQREVIFKVSNVGETELEFEMLSYTVPAEKVPEALKETIIIESKDAPKLLDLVVTCLL